MAAKVIDASALAALMFGEPEAEAVTDRLKDADLVAPTLLPFELANICLKKIRRYPSRRADWLHGFAMLGRMTVSTVEIDPADVIALAEQSGLTAYDASYLWLSRELGVELVTLDRRLEAAASPPSR